MYKLNKAPVYVATSTPSIKLRNQWTDIHKIWSEHHTAADYPYALMIYSGNNMTGAGIFEAPTKTTALNTKYWIDLC